MGRDPNDGPLWRAYDRAVAEAWLEWTDLLCACGHPRDEVWTGDADGQWETSRHKCRVCASTEVAQQAYERETGPGGTSAPLPGVKFVTTRGG